MTVQGQMVYLERVTREEKLKKELKLVVHKLATDYDAERVILFGSMVSGEITDYSDVDLVVIKNTELPFYGRLKEVANVCKWHCGFDVLVYTPEEFAEMSKTNPFIRDEVVKKGKLLYERVA